MHIDPNVRDALAVTLVILLMLTTGGGIHLFFVRIREFIESRHHARRNQYVVNEFYAVHRATREMQHPREIKLQRLRERQKQHVAAQNLAKRLPAPPPPVLELEETPRAKILFVNSKLILTHEIWLPVVERPLESKLSGGLTGRKIDHPDLRELWIL